MATDTISQQPDKAAEHRPRVAIVDADHRIRRSLGDLLSVAGVEVVGEAGSTEEAIRLVDAARPALVLVDPLLPDYAAGEALIAAIRRDHPETQVAVMGWSNGPIDGRDAAGSGMFLHKDSSPEEFVAAALAACACAAIA